LADLMYLSKGNGGGGLAFHGMGFTGEDVPYTYTIPINGRTKYKRINGIRKDANNVAVYQKWHDTFGLKGIIPGPSAMWILKDNTFADNWYYPDAGDSHGIFGANVAFCDGSASWVKRENFIYKYELSQDENRTGIKIPWAHKY